MIVLPPNTFKRVRVLVHAPAPGKWCMAVDQVLLESALERGVTTLRLYQWSEPTLSLGYFQQRPDVSATAGRWQGLPVVRRLSGGGAILHHHELTYALALPAGHPHAADPTAVYRNVHLCVADLLSQQGVALSLRGAALPEREGSFLCFSRGDPNDLVAGGHKLLGSAQRRRRGALLQHGSLILAASPSAPEILGLKELTGRTWNPEELGTELASRLPQVLGGFSVPDSLTDEETRRVDSLIQQL